MEGEKPRHQSHNYRRGGGNFHQRYDRRDNRNYNQRGRGYRRDNRDYRSYDRPRYHDREQHQQRQRNQEYQQREQQPPKQIAPSMYNCSEIFT